MHHDIRQTAREIARSLALIAPLPYRREQALPLWGFQASERPAAARPVDPDFDDSGWPAVPARSYWGAPNVNFVLRGRLAGPPDWERDAPVALFLPLGDGGGFSHP